MFAPAGGFTESLLNCFEPRLAVRDSSPLLDERLPFLGLLGFSFAASNTYSSTIELRTKPTKSVTAFAMQDHTEMF